MSESDMQEAMGLVQEATDRIRAGESDLEEVALPNGAKLKIFREGGADGRVVVEARSGESILRSSPFQGADHRPTGYPDDMPFLAGSASTLTEAGEGRARTMVWPNPSDPDRQFDEALEQLVQMGWEEAARSEKDTEFGGVQSVDFIREGEQRSMFLNRVGDRAQLMAVDHPPMQDEEEQGA
jgi:hypothetical protein